MVSFNLCFLPFLPTLMHEASVFLHIHGNKLFLFYCDCKYKKFFGYEVKIKELNGILPEKLVSHEYKNLHIRFKYTTDPNVDICILLALNDSDNAIYLEEMDYSRIRYKELCKKEEDSNKRCTIISLNERDYLDLDPNNYDQLFLIGYYGKVTTPTVVLDTVKKLKSLDEIVYAYFRNCSSVPVEFIQWIGLENAKSYTRKNGNSKDILDIAVMEYQYDVIEYLVKQGLCFKAFLSD